MVSVVSSDLLSISADYIAHQVNCRGVMGAGLALTLRRSNPRLFALYQQHCRQHSPHDLLGRAFVCDNIISIFGQLNYGRDRSVVYTDYSALHRAFTSIHKRLPLDRSIAFPFGFGCGLANGDWNIVKQLIIDCFPDRTIYICKI
jgi:O-acetyl-ADP-ribose deacetylase (regulator of RNase III)